MILADATVECTHDGSAVVGNGAIYKKERNVDLQFELESNDVDSMSNTFAQKDTIFSTTNKTVAFSFTTVLGKLGTTGLTVTDTIADGVADMMKISNLTMADGTPVGGLKVFDFTPNSTRQGAGEVTVKTPDRTVVIEKANAVVSISVSKGGETELKFDVTGVVKSDTTGQTNTLSDPVKPKASVLTTTDGINTGVTVNSQIVDPLSVSFGMNIDRNYARGLTEILNIINNADHQLSISAYLSSGKFEEGYDAIVSGTEIAVQVDFEDTSDTVLWGLSIPKAKVMNTPNRNNTDGVYAIEKQYRCRPTAGNDNFTLKYYSDIAAA
ncbi:hypothetical protein ACM66T_10230 [Sulfurimonas sp. ST-25]|uniref:hypothetical protein n=1 Tax=Sulfurimonas sp. ST-25 TaxID=3400151 RepID=UPI003A86FDC1